MKITKAQKEAIVREISRRVDKEYQTYSDNFKKNYKFTKEEKELLALCKETDEIAEKYETLKGKNLELARKFGYTGYSHLTSEGAKNRILNNRLCENNPIKRINSSEIQDQLEFATLDPSFNVEEFIKKYI